VPLPWSLDGPSYGFGAQGGGHLPQPDWFAGYGVSVQAADPDSTLNLYRRALELRGHLFAGTDLGWIESDPQVLHFERGSRIWCVANFDAEPVALPAGEVLLSSAPLDDGRLPGDTTVWLRAL
jgi:alpha-glucosidase